MSVLRGGWYVDRAILGPPGRHLQTCKAPPSKVGCAVVGEGMSAEEHAIFVRFSGTPEKDGFS
eukprot:2752909-Alexandrium_andersonii.AAC.1